MANNPNRRATAFEIAKSVMQIHYGLLPDFKGGDTLLFVGDASAIKMLSDLLRTFAEEKGQVKLSLPDFVGHLCLVTLTSSDSETSSVIWRAGLRSAEWQIGPNAALDCAEKLLTICDMVSAHQFVETEGVIQIMISKGEYSLEIFG